jgi:hypothetical protein
VLVGDAGVLVRGPAVVISTGAGSAGSASNIARALPQSSHAQLRQRSSHSSYRFAESSYFETKGGYQLWLESQRVYLCLTPKIGSTSWMTYIKANLPHPPPDAQARALAALAQARRRAPPARNVTTVTTFLRVNNPPAGLFFRDFKTDAHVPIVNDPAYTKVAVVRHPWDRLVSAYRSKYEGVCNFQRRCMKRTFMLHLLRDKDDSYLSFHEFVGTLFRMSPAQLDAHFKPQTLVCEMHRIKYDLFADLSVPADMDKVSRLLGFATPFSEAKNSELSRFRGGALPSSTAGDNSSSAVYYEGRTHLVQNCTVDTVAMAESIYAQDALILGYSFDAAYKACAERGVSS